MALPEPRLSLGLIDELDLCADQIHARGDDPQSFEACFQ